MRMTMALAALSLAALPVAAEAQLRIAIIGDSLASGEGNPDASPGGCNVPGSGVVCSSSLVWVGRNGRTATPADDACHRSTASGLLRAAEQLRDDLTGIEPVIIETFACTGANAAAATRQLGALARSRLFLDAGTRRFTGDRIDAVIMAVGANDMGFAPFALRCSLPGPECHSSTTLTSMLGGLPGAYGGLAGAITGLPLDGRVGNVFIVEYQQPSMGPDTYCGGTVAVQPSGAVVQPVPPDLLFNVSWFESRFVTRSLVPALNATIAAEAGRNGWQFVGGIADRFLGHGHCAADRWVRDLEDSLALQFSHMGVFHPNVVGHDAYRDRVRAALEPYVERLAPPVRTSFRSADLVEGQGGAGPLLQVATLALASARPSARALVPPPPGFAGDGARQRVRLDRRGRRVVMQASGFPGPPWLLAEVPTGEATAAAANVHWVAAARRCNSLRCSAWAPSVIAPAAPPSSAMLARTSSNLILATWPTHVRNGAYQVAVPAGRGRWKIYDVASRADSDRMSNAGVAPRDWEEGALPIVAPQGVASDSRSAAVRPGSLSAKISEFFVRGCNQGGCSEWVGAADYVNALARPVPGSFRSVTGLSCEAGGTCRQVDTGGRLTAWPEIAGANVYQILAYRGSLPPEQIVIDRPWVALEAGRHSGLRLRACNLAGCSGWSDLLILDHEAPVSAPPADSFEPPENFSRAAVAGVPPSSLPPSTL